VKSSPINHHVQPISVGFNWRDEMFEHTGTGVYNVTSIYKICLEVGKFMYDAINLSHTLYLMNIIPSSPQMFICLIRSNLELGSLCCRKYVQN